MPSEGFGPLPSDYPSCLDMLGLALRHRFIEIAVTSIVDVITSSMICVPEKIVFDIIVL